MFVSHTPGVELVLEAFEGYWRKVPNIKRLTIKSVPEESTRLAMLKKGKPILPLPCRERSPRMSNAIPH